MKQHDPEIAALRKISRILDQFDKATKRRILLWLASREGFAPWAEVKTVGEDKYRMSLGLGPDGDR